MTKTCTKCGIEQSYSEFRRSDKYRDGRQNICRICTNKASAAWRKKNPDKVKKYKTNWDKKNSHRFRGYALKTNFNMTEEEYEAISKAQGDVCAICKQPETIKDRRLAVDHNHQNNQNRGLLCFNCNIGIGKLEHCWDAAKEYMELFRPLETK